MTAYDVADRVAWEPPVVNRPTGLSPLYWRLLTAHSVTGFLDGYLGAPIRAGISEQRLVRLVPGPGGAAPLLAVGPDDDGIPEPLPPALGAEAGEALLVRTVLLWGLPVHGGRRVRRPVVAATSHLLVDRLPTPLVAGLLTTDTPIGRLLAGYRVDTSLRILGWALQRAGVHGPAFGVPYDHPVLHRMTRREVAGRPVMVVTETFCDVPLALHEAPPAS